MASYDIADYEHLDKDDLLVYLTNIIGILKSEKSRGEFLDRALTTERVQHQLVLKHLSGHEERLEKMDAIKAQNRKLKKEIRELEEHQDVLRRKAEWAMKESLAHMEEALQADRRPDWVTAMRSRRPMKEVVIEGSVYLVPK